MFVAHVLAFLGWAASQDFSLRPPYWWGYLVLYPATGWAAARLSRASWGQIAICLCTPPILYFLALGVLEADWLASDGALWGGLLALALTALVAFVARPTATVVPPDEEL
ncbi:MAG TPA: hypothetical protein VMO26_30055 [Vicinamibacterales bacterium]|nr:hypothetical protein [Vicinamibacterales bacterium]